jgi:hypothetical protein
VVQKSNDTIVVESWMKWESQGYLVERIEIDLEWKNLMLLTEESTKLVLEVVEEWSVEVGMRIRRNFLVEE